jgi:hypothetical protein
MKWHFGGSKNPPAVVPQSYSSILPSGRFKFFEIFCNKRTSGGVCIGKTPAVLEYVRIVRIISSLRRQGRIHKMETNDAITLRDGIYYIRLSLPWAEAPVDIALHGIATIADALVAYGILNNSSRMVFA